MATIVVKGTFLEVTEDDHDNEEQPSAGRNFTAPGGLTGHLPGNKRQDGSMNAQYVEDGTGVWRKASQLETMAEEEAEDDQAAREGGRPSQKARTPKEKAAGTSKRSPKMSNAKRSPKSPGGMVADPWGFGVAQAAAGQFAGLPAQSASSLGGVPPVPMPMMPGFFPPWPPTPNPFMAAAMNAAAMQMMAAGMPTGMTGMPGTMAGFTGVPGMHGMAGMSSMGAIPGMPTMPGMQAPMTPVSPQRRGKKSQQQSAHLSPTMPSAPPVLFDAGEAQGRTTVMIRNVPNNYTRTMLLDLLDSQGLAGRYDFVYLPFDFKTEAGLGFAFVNLLTPEDAELCKAHLTGFRSWAIPSGKVCEVGWSGADQQGLDANIERYRNSSVMHSSVADELKPVKFVNGIQVPFPRPTRKVWPPHSNYGLRARRAAAAQAFPE